MIITVTMNPSIDKLYIVDAFSPFAVMRVKQVNNTAGGKGVNVARVASQMGEPVTATGIIGGFHGQYLETLLHRQSIHSQFTIGPQETRCCINIQETASGQHTEFLEPGPPIDQDTLERFLQQYKQLVVTGQVITLSGSLPAGIPADFYGELIKEAHRFGKQVLLDTSGEPLRKGIESNPDLIKPNREELSQLLGSPISSKEQAIQAAETLRQRGIQTVVVSLGKEGAVMACPEGLFYGIAPEAQTVNTVGCGDSMIAGFAVGLSRKQSFAQCLKMAIAVSVANTLTKETGSFQQKDFERLLPQVSILSFCE